MDGKSIRPDIEGAVKGGNITSLGSLRGHMCPHSRPPMKGSRELDEEEARAEQGRVPQITVGKFWGKKFLLEQKGNKSYYILNIKCQNAFICITVCGDYISGCIRTSKISLRKIMQHKGRGPMPWKFGDIFLLWVVFGALKYTSSTGSLALITADFLWPSPHLTSQVPCTFYIYSQSLSQQYLFRWTS